MIIDTTNIVKWNFKKATDKHISNGFDEKLSKAKSIEKAFGDWCKNNLIMYDLDIDCMLQCVEVNQVFTVEIKRDWQIGQTGNIFFEDCFDRQYGGEGWLRKSKADFMLFATDHPSMYGYFILFDFFSVRKLIEDNKMEKKYIKFWNKVDKCYGWGYVISLQEIKNKVNYVDGYINLKKYDK